MNHLSLFSGIGGLDLAAEWAGFRTVAFVERDPYCQRVLARRWPGVPILSDVRNVGHAQFAPEDVHAAPANEAERREIPVGESGGGGIRIVSGGFPCQPHSVAGKRQASADDRDLWPEFARVIREIRPRWVVAENVPGLLHSESGRFFGSVLGDLADMGYSAGWGVWGAADVGALHRRERVFIVARDMADPDDAGLQGRERRSMRERADQWPVGASRSPVGNASRELLHGAGLRATEAGRGEPTDAGWWGVEPDVGRVAHGVPSRVDRLRALGNAVVPQQAYPLFAEIARIERMNDFEYAE